MHLSTYVTVATQALDVRHIHGCGAASASASASARASSELSRMGRLELELTERHVQYILLCLVGLVGYADRINMSVAVIGMAEELDWTLMQVSY